MKKNNRLPDYLLGNYHFYKLVTAFGVRDSSKKMRFKNLGFSHFEKSSSSDFTFTKKSKNVTK